MAKKTRAEIQKAYRQRKADKQHMRTVTLLLPIELIERIDLAFPGDGISEKMMAALYDGTQERLTNADEADYTDVANDIDTALHGIPDTRGDGKFFVSDMYRAVSELYPDGYIPIDEFKWRLLQAHKARRLRLTRLDLVTSDNEQSGVDSEITDGLAAFHFIEAAMGACNKLPPSFDDKLAAANAKNMELEKKIAVLEAKLGGEKGLPAGVTVSITGDQG